MGEGSWESGEGAGVWRLASGVWRLASGVWGRILGATHDLDLPPTLRGVWGGRGCGVGNGRWGRKGR
jgi:hypothetical protein